MGQGIVLVASASLPALAIVALVPVVPALIDRFHDVPDVGLRVPLLISAPGLAIALLAPIVGYLLDRFGRCRLLIAATFLYGFAGTAPLLVHSLGGIFVSRLFVGVAEAVILTATNTLIADYWEPDGRRRWLVVQGIAGTVVASGAIALSGVLTKIQWNAAFGVYAAALLIAAGMVAVLFEPPRRGADSAGGAAASRFPWRDTALIGGVTMFVSVLYYVFIIQGGLIFREIGITDSARTGLFISIGSVGVPVGALVFGAVGKWATRSILLTLLFLGVGLAGMGLTHTPYTALPFLFVQQTGAGMSVLSLIYWAQGALPLEHRGRGMGVWSSCFFLGQFISPFFVEAAHRWTGSVHGAFVVLGCTALAGAAAAVTRLGRHKKG
jgi:MFS family permease